MSGWTPEQDAQLVDMINQGQSASYVGKAMGRSRNSVMGRAHRKALQFKSKVVKPRKPKQKSYAFFTEDHDQAIRRLAGECKSSTDIAKEISRSASSIKKRAKIIGAKLTARNGPKPGAAPKATTVKTDKRSFHPGNITNKRDSRANDPVFRHVTPSVPLQPLMVALVDLRPNMCRFPIGDPREEGFGFCGHPMEQGSYCRSHARLAYQAPEARRRAA